MAESEQRELEVVEAARGGHELGQVGGGVLAQRVAAQVEQGERVEGVGSAAVACGRRRNLCLTGFMQVKLSCEQYSNHY